MISEQAYALCIAIEELPASEKQTQISVMAAELRAKVAGVGEFDNKIKVQNKTIGDLKAHIERIGVDYDDVVSRAEAAEARVRELEATIDATAEAHAHDDMALTAAYLSGAHEGKKQAEAEQDALRERCEKLEWLVEVQEFYMYRLRNPGGWSTPGMERAKTNVAWQRRSASNDELRAMYIAATEVKP